MAWHLAEADTRAFVVQCPEEVHDMTNKGFFISSPLIACKQDIESV